MIKRTDLLTLNFYKKEKFTGSFHGMRYRVEKTDDGLLATVWPEPFNFEKTPGELKTSATFPFDEEGLSLVTEYLNNQYTSREAEWKSTGLNFTSESFPRPAEP
ncbi:MAG: GNAT family acetyltransferase [Lachnospiraceae bacterium]|nr:GNAT family acetyltransferase [Lachnospiraceae bacterium]